MPTIVVDVMPKAELLDPQGKAVSGAFERLGHTQFSAVRIGKRFELTVDGEVTDEVLASAREIAEQYDIPIELMAKVLQRLARRGLLSSQQGTRGGYQLGRPSALISVADVIQAVDGPLTVTACSTDDQACEQFTKCNVRDPLWRIKDRILTALAGCTLAEIVDESSAPTMPVSLSRRTPANV